MALNAQKYPKTGVLYAHTSLLTSLTESHTMISPIDNLPETLSRHLLDAQWDSSATSPVHSRIRHLTSLTRAWRLGDMSDEELETIFRNNVPDFDIMLWLEEAGIPA